MARNLLFKYLKWFCIFQIACVAILVLSAVWFVVSSSIAEKQTMDLAFDFLYALQVEDYETMATYMEKENGEPFTAQEVEQYVKEVGIDTWGILEEDDLEVATSTSLHSTSYKGVGYRLVRVFGDGKAYSIYCDWNLFSCKICVIVEY